MLHNLLLYTLPAVLVLLVASTFFLSSLLRKNKALALEVVKKKNELDRTSKVLIQKNVELIEQTLRQQKLLESKDDFVAIVSHQLRTPITEIKWNASAILEDPAWGLTPEHRRMVEQQLASAVRMVSIVSTILQLVASEQHAARSSVSPYAPDEVVRDASERVARDFHEKHIACVLDLNYGASIYSIDPESFAMLVGNLLENAFHYTPRGGTITVRTKHGEMGEFVVLIEDTGMGISEEKQKTMFQKFIREKDAIKVNEGGSGLGLYIVKNVLEQRGGSITFTSTKGVGSVFRLTLPQQKAK
ncbi:MAG: HAMP domain-containing sensor histidine kinase [bacterium]